MKTNLPLFVFILLSFVTSAQSIDQRCGTDALHEQLMLDSEFATQFIKHQEEIRSKVDPTKVVICANPVIVPVAVHYSGTVTTANVNCLIDKCNEQIQVMNEDFGGYNPDITNYCDISDACPADYPPTSITHGSCIQFCLGSSNHPACEPAGNLIGGLAITVGEYTWPNTGGCWSGYMNIFVYNLGGGLLGQAPLFGASNPNGNGFRVTASAFGGSGSGCTSGTGIDTQGTYNLGRTATHEAGHYFGLPHTFAGCNNGDGIGDTPSQNNSNFGCPSVNLTTCTSTSSNSCGEADFWFNFMDYVNDACMWMFTEDQSQFMYNVANAGQWNSGTCFPAQAYSPTFPTGCAVTVTPLQLFLVSQQDVLCPGELSGNILVEATGGQMPYVFFVNGANYGSNPDFSNLPADNYIIQVFDNLGSSAEITLTLNEPTPIIAFADPVLNVSCFGENDGSFVLNISGGTPFAQGYSTSVDFNNVGFQTIFTELEAGLYPILIEDANGCEFEFEVEINEPPAMSLSADTIGTNLCFGDSTALLELSVSGGFPNYTFTIYDTIMNNTGVFQNIGGDSLIVTLEDNNGCEIIETFFIPQPDSLSLNNDILTDNFCFGEEQGEIMLLADGGNGDFTYELMGVGSNATGYFDDLPSGEYYASAVDSNGCQALDTLLINTPQELLLNIDQMTPVTCGGQMDGAVMVSGSGGSADYFYSIDGITYGTSGNFANLGGGNYTIYIQDGNDCIVSEDIVLPEDSPLSLTAVNITDAFCIGVDSGSIEVEATGGAGQITYTLDSQSNMTGFFMGLPVGMYTITALDENDCSSLINLEVAASSTLDVSLINSSDLLCTDDGTGQISIEGVGGNGGFIYSINGVNFGASGIFTNLAADTYELTVQDNSGCKASIMVTLEQPDPLTLASQNVEGINCFGDADGTITVQATGGTAPINYSIASIAQVNTTGQFTNLEAAIYTVLIIDENSCSIELMLEIDEPSEITFDVSNEVPSNCDGDPIGGFTVTADGGGGGYNYIYLTQSNTTGIFQNLAAGNHDVLIMDAAGCSTTASVNVSSGSNIFPSINMEADPSCDGDLDGSVQVSATGGTGTISYNLDGEINTTGTFIGLSAGNYVISITDIADCLTTINFELMDPNPIILSIGSTTAATCDGGNNGTVELLADGGNGGFTFTVNTETNMTGVFTTLPSGSYTALVTDINNCQETISFEIDGPPAINGSVMNQTDVSCFGGSDGSVTFGSDLTVQVFLDGVLQLPLDLASLEAGDYEFVLMTTDDCFESIFVTISEPDQMLINTDQLTDNNCVGLSEGSFTLSATGGNGGYTYVIPGTSNMTGNFTNLPSGNYPVLVEDQEACQETVEITIGALNNPQATLLTSSFDTGGANGTAEISATGGTEPYMYSLNGGAVTASPIFDNLAAGAYTVEIVDNLGCQFMVSFVIDLMERPDNKDIIEIKCRPNPTVGIFYLSYESNGDQHIDFNIFDARGQFIATFPQEAKSGVNEISFDMASLVAGVYLLQIDGQRLSITKKVVKMN